LLGSRGKNARRKPIRLVSSGKLGRNKILAKTWNEDEEEMKKKILKIKQKTQRTIRSNINLAEACERT